MKTFNIQAPTPQGPALRDQQAFLIGLDFHESALRAGEVVRDPQGAPILALCPMIVSLAFAAELYLKSLQTVLVRGHRLDTLYNRADVGFQNDIAAFYQRRTGRDIGKLKIDLKAFSVAFLDWRYVFEGEGQQIHFNLLLAFTKSVYETIRKVRTHWKVRDYLDERIRADAAEPTMTIVNLGGGTFIQLVDGTGGKLNLPDA